LLAVKPRSNAEKFGAAVRRLREQAGISQEELADRCGLHRTYVGSVERGERNVSLDNVVRLAKALSVSASELMEDL
jgi:transcriptional regulator with XRE-family HTH domain